MKKPNKLLYLVIYYCFTITLSSAQSLPNPILFCTKVPNAADFTTSMSTFGNHLSSLQAAPRGGDLYILYPNGTLKNLTQLTGFGQVGLQGANAIAVRDPHVHWSGTKAIFSMVIGAPTEQYEVNNYYWQLYEVTGLGINDSPIIEKVNNQPGIYNNVSPIYGTDGRIIFVSDRPRNGEAHLYPQHDEYESTPIVTGLWRIDPNACTGNSNNIEMLTTSPSGDFTPIIDSYGRIVFTRWDHLQRDQQADGDFVEGSNYGTFNFSDEGANAVKSIGDIEVFPEPRQVRLDSGLMNLPEWQNTNGLRVNQFNPWMVNEDGKELETLNHIGRHELNGFFTPNFNNDDNLDDFIIAGSSNIQNMFHIKESPVTPGLYFATIAPEFGTHASGMILSMLLPAGKSADSAFLTKLTHPDTQEPTANPSVNHSGLYRNAIPLSDGQIIVSHTFETRVDDDDGMQNTHSRYAYRLRFLEKNGQYYKGITTLTNGISKNISFWDPDALVTYSGELWESFPVEVRVHPKPINTTLNTVEVPAIEAALFQAANIEVSQFKRFLKRNNLALLISRNVTSRDDKDRQQPFNLKIVNSSTQTIDPNSPTNIYEVKYLQFLQGDQIRGIGGIDNPDPGRRMIAQFMHDTTALAYNLSTTGAEGSIDLASDGSVVTLVPANRALAWQLTDANDKGIVRERVWLSFQAGEIRVCASCHGLNDTDQAGNGLPTNPPMALTQLLNHLKTIDSDNDNIIDIYDAYPNDNMKQVGEALSEDFVNQLAEWVNSDTDGGSIMWETSTVTCQDEVVSINNQLASNGNEQLSHFIDLTNFGEASLTFDVAYAQYDANTFDGLNVLVLPCNNEDTTTVYQKSGSDLATVPNQQGLFTPTGCSQWRTETIDLSAFAGQSFDLVFENIGGGGNQLFLDNITLTEQTVGTAACTVENLNINTNPLDQSTYFAIDYLTANTQILENRTVTYKAGKSITLNVGFHAKMNSNFLAQIKDCNAVAFQEEQEEQYNKGVVITSLNDQITHQKESSNIQLNIYPNPFKHQATIDYYLPQDGLVIIKMVDLVGQVVSVLTNQLAQNKGLHSLNFQARNLQNGTYFIVLQSGGQVLTKRLVFMKE